MTENNREHDAAAGTGAVRIGTRSGETYRIWRAGEFSLELHDKYILGRHGCEYALRQGDATVATGFAEDFGDAVEKSRMELARHLAHLEALANSCREILSGISAEEKGRD